MGRKSKLAHFRGPTADRIRAKARERFELLTQNAVGDRTTFETWTDFARDFPEAFPDSRAILLCRSSELPPLVELDGVDVPWALEHPAGLLELVALRRKDARTRFLVRAPSVPGAGLVRRLAIGAFYTDDRPYRDFLPRFVAHYQKQRRILEDLEIQTRIVIVWFGAKWRVPIDAEAEDVDLVVLPRVDFAEWTACQTILDHSIRELDADHVLRLDGDTYLDRSVLRRLVDRADHSGPAVWNIKQNETTGPGILFGHSFILGANDYLKGWPAPFYHVDTEYLGHFPRSGYLPRVLYLPMGREDHGRPLQGMQGTNFPRLLEVTHKGRAAVLEEEAAAQEKQEEASGAV